jgi:DNA-binding MarR family transcriptional regulator
MSSIRPASAAALALNGLVTALVRGRPREMSLTSLSTMATLERTGPRRITELAVIEGVAQPSMTTLVGNLERDGFVDRQTDPDDGRVTLAAITDLGVRYLEGRRQQNAESLERLIEKLDDAEREALISAVEAVVHLTQLDQAERDPAHARA